MAKRKKPTRPRVTNPEIELKKIASDASKRMKISAAALAELKNMKSSRRIETLGPSEDIFRPAKPAPGVVPKGSPVMAMDENIGDIVTWGSSTITSMIAEGMVFLGYPYLAELAQRPEYRRISEVIATECTREWIEFKGKGGKDITEKVGELETELKRLDLQGAVRQTLMNDGYFGRGHVYIDTGATDDPDELKTSLADAKGVLSKAKIKKGSLRRFKPIEPAWTYPVDYDSSDPLSDRWYAPDMWFVMGKKVHTTRIPTFIGRPVPDLLKPAYSFGGLSLSQMAKPYVDNWLRTRQSVSDIISSFSVMVIATNMQTLLQGGAATDVITRADIFNMLRDNSGVFMINKETEDFKNVAAPLGTLDTLQAQSLEHICSVTGLPLLEYTGISPTGLNASSEGEIRSFYDWCKAYNETFRRPTTQCIDAAQISLWGAVDPDIVYIYKPLWSLDEKARAEVEKTKAETDSIYINDCNSLSPAEARKRLAGDAESPYEGLDPDDVPEPPEPEMDPDGEEGDTDEIDQIDPNASPAERAGKKNEPGKPAVKFNG